jgi:hypothetical protein
MDRVSQELRVAQLRLDDISRNKTDLEQQVAEKEDDIQAQSKSLQAIMETNNLEKRRHEQLEVGNSLLFVFIRNCSSLTLLALFPEYHHRLN